MAPKLSDPNARMSHRLPTVPSSRPRTIIADLSWRRAPPPRKVHSGSKRRMQILRRRIQQLPTNRGILKLQARAQKRPRQRATRNPAKDFQGDLLRRSSTARSCRDSSRKPLERREAPHLFRYPQKTLLLSSVLIFLSRTRRGKVGAWGLQARSPKGT